MRKCDTNCDELHDPRSEFVDLCLFAVFVADGMRILILSRYDRLGPSSRLRVFQYLPFLQDAGVEFVVAPLFGNDYVASLYGGRISLAAVVKAYFRRLYWMLRAGGFDLIWVEKEFLPWVPSWIELRLLPLSTPWVADYDDAVFHRYDRHQLSWVRRILGRKIDAVMRHADLVLAGNEYLKERALQAGASRVEILPTVVDVSRYQVSKERSGGTVTIGWIGSPSTARYLHLIAPALQKVAALQNVRIIAVGANADQLKGLPIEVRKWTEASEVAEIQQFDIGIMPLPDEPFERGKCGYKLIQCMACGKAVVASPVGVNSVIVRDGIDGILASSNQQWFDALKKLIEDVELRRRMGSLGRERVEQHYSLQNSASRLVELLQSCLN